jgi:hypothetical protein
MHVLADNKDRLTAISALVAIRLGIGIAILGQMYVSVNASRGNHGAVTLDDLRGRGRYEAAAEAGDESILDAYITHKRAVDTCIAKNQIEVCHIQ